MRTTSPAEISPSLLATSQQTYDRHGFLDVWRATAEWWTPATDPGRLTTAELVFAARLAVRLGGPRLSRSLFWRARKADPSDPAVRYFTEHLTRPGDLLLDGLLAFERDPRLDGADAELQAQWLSTHAFEWARLRNGDRAAELMREAHALDPESSWLYSLDSDIHGMADDWPAALLSAERAWQLDPAAAWSAASLGSALLNCGELDEAVRRLEASAVGTQSASLVQTACWYRCAATELLEGDARAESLERARALAGQIAPLAPLADREFRAGLARTWLDIAQLAGDHEGMERWADEAGSPFHRKVLSNLRSNPGGKVVRLPYRRALQRHMECVPASVASALSASGIELSVAELAAEVTFGGTAEWAAADWLRARGFHVRFFQATATTSARLLDAGFGFVTSWEDDDSGHAVAMVGIDHAAGTVLVHDPTSFRSTEYLLGAFAEDGSPLGVSGMTAVRPERAAELDSLLPPEAAVAEADQAHRRALAMVGPSAGQAVVAELRARFPEHPGTLYLQAMQDLEDGRMGQALTSLRELAGRFPRARRLRSNLVFACRSVGNSALLRQTLEAIVETGVVPGVRAEVDWVRPHPRYVCDYADLLRAVSGTRPEAERLLRSVLRTNWASAHAWHVLADLRWEQRKTEGALLAYSVASHLAEHNEHYARAYADVLAREHRVEQGLSWLERRARRLGGSAQGVSTWITWTDMLEDRGYPERALAALGEALERHPAVPSLLAYAVSFLARMGRWEESEARLGQLEKNEAQGVFHEAAVGFHRMRGEPLLALEHAEAFVAAFPRNMSARYALLGLLSTLGGETSAATRAAEWMHAYPANESFEEAYCSYAQERLNWRRVRLLRTRVKRNPDDGWAWRELAFHAMNVFEQAGPSRRERLQPWIATCLAEAERVSHGSAATLRMQALWLEDSRRWRDAVEAYVEAAAADPSNFYGFRRAWECAARLPDAERRALWRRMEPLYLETEGHLPHAPEMMGLLAGRFGVRETETIVAGWRTRRPADPNVLKAAADLLLNHGHGRTDAARALELLQAAVERFPYHAGLRFSLASACRATGDYAAADGAFAELVLRRPDDNAALIQLAWIQQNEGRTEDALATLNRAHAQMPQASAPFDNRARILIAAGRMVEARAVVAELLTSLPEGVSTYERAIALYKRCGLPEQAVEAARAGVRAFPRGAYLWLLLGKALQNEPRFASPGEVEVCLERSLARNHTLFEAADWRAMYLADQHRQAEAAALLRAIEPDLPDPSPALGRLAWLDRRNGNLPAATEALAAVVRAAPWYTWGWGRLLDWLEQDKSWKLARELLDTVPAPMLTEVEFRQKRLHLLSKAGVPDSTLDPEWDELLRDFPRDIPLQLLRYDSLDGAKRLPEAAAILRRALPDAGENSYLLARLVAVECREKSFPDAMGHGLTVCFAATEESVWPANQVWSRMRAAGQGPEFTAAFDRQLQEGKRPTRRSLVLYAEDRMGQAAHDHASAWLRQTWFDSGSRRGAELLRLVERSAWKEAGYLADLMTVLNQRKYRRLVLGCWKRMVAAGLGNETRAWAEAGLALINSDRTGAARALLQDWRGRPGVEMWMVTNYLLALSRVRREQLAEVIRTAHDALARLPHDHAARLIAYLEAEARALAGDRAGLLAVWKQQRHAFESAPDAEDYFPAARRYLIADVAEAVRRLQAGNERGFRRTVWGLRMQRLLGKERRKKIWKWMLYLLRALLVLAAAGSLLRHLFE